MFFFDGFLFQLFREGQGQSAVFKFGMDILFLQVLADVEASAYIAAVTLLTDVFNRFLIGFSIFLGSIRLWMPAQLLQQPAVPPPALPSQLQC